MFSATHTLNILSEFSYVPNAGFFYAHNEHTLYHLEYVIDVITVETINFFLTYHVCLLFESFCLQRSAYTRTQLMCLGPKSAMQ